MMAKLTLSVDVEVVSLAKQYAKERGVSVSEIVEAYLSAVARPVIVKSDLPVLRALRGSLQIADVEEYRQQLANKYE